MFSSRTATYLRVAPTRPVATHLLRPSHLIQYTNYATRKPRPNEPKVVRTPDRPLELDLMDIPNTSETTLEPPPAKTSPKPKHKPKFHDVYQQLRKRVTDLPLPEFQSRHVWAFCNLAHKNKDTSVIENLASAVVRCVQEDDMSEWVKPFVYSNHITHCRPETAVELFAMLSEKERSVQATTLFAHPGVASDPALLAKVAPYFGGPMDPEERVWASLDMLAQLTAHGLRPEALSLLERLVATGRIPPEALRGEELGVRDFYAIVHVAVARACLHWNLSVQAARHTARVIVHLTRNQEPLGEVGAFAVDMLRAVTVNAGREETIAAVGILRALLQYTRSPRIPDGTLHALYESLYSNDMPDYAARVYAWTQAPIVRKHSYPPPRGEALPWLMEHLCNNAKDAYRARLLATHVTDLDAPLAPNVRANFITLVAGQGLAVAARTLWERYASGRFASAVTANARLLVRMCSLFASLARREQERIESLEVPHRWEAEQRPRSADKEQFMSSTGGQPTMLEAELSEHDSSGTHSFEDAHASDRSRGAIGSLVALDVPRPPSEMKAGTDRSTPGHSNEDRQARYEDYMSFARRVRDQYVLAKHPIDKARPWDLNALARVHFILGDDEDGFKALDMARSRGRQPDAHDVSVAIGAVAREDPVAGVRMLKTLASHGRLEPVALGTVVHHALQAGNVHGAEEAMALGRDHNIGLDLKSMDSVLRATLLFSQHDRAALRDNLRRILAVVRSNQSAPTLAVVSVGNACVRAALDAGDSALAYDFWHEILRTREDRWDQERKRLRKNIVGLVLKQRKLLGVETAHAMVDTLKNPSGKAGPFDVSGVGEQFGVRPSELGVVDGPVPGAKPFEQEVEEWEGEEAVEQETEWDGALGVSGGRSAGRV